MNRMREIGIKGGELIASVIPWNRLIVDPVDFDALPRIEKFYKTPAQLRRMKEYNKAKVDSLISAITARKTLSGSQKDNQSEFIECWEVHGELDSRLLDDNPDLSREDKDIKYIQQMHVISFVKNDKEGYKKSEWLTQLFDRIKTNGVADSVVFDPTIVRGLDYYTKTVFEGWDVNGEFRAIWGGGRYDNLTADVGSKTKIPGVGFAMGDMTLMEVLKANGKYLILNPCPTQILVTIFSPDYYDQSYKVTDTLRKCGINAETYLDPSTKLDKQIKYADKKGIPLVVIIGPDEVEKGLVTLKNLKTRDQKTINQKEILNLTL